MTFRTLTTFALGLSLSFTAATASAQSSWSADPTHSEVGFSVKHLMVSNVKGQFKKYDVKVALDEKDITKSTLDVTIEAGSIDTGLADRDAHLKSPEFFNVEKNPNLTFKSTKIAKAGKNGLKVTGDLTMNGVTKSVVLNVEGPTSEIKDPWGNIKRGVSATTTIKRTDFGLNWNKALEAGGVVVGEEVKITLELELVKKAA